MAINKVVYGGRTLIDLTGVTVTPEVLLAGYTAYDASGNLITGTYGAVSNLLTMNDGKINKRLNSSNSELNANGYFITDYFDFDYTKTRGLRIVGGVANIGSLGTNSYGNCMITVYDASKNRIGQWFISRRQAGSESAFPADGNDIVNADIGTNHGASLASLADISDWTTVKFIRLTLALNNAASAIGSVSDVLNSGMKIYAE